MTLKSEIEALANTFADGVLAALRNASLEDLLEGRVSPAAKSAPARTKTSTTPSPQKTASGRGRRSPSDIAHVEGVIVAKLREHRAGLRSEQLQKVLKLSKAEIVRPIASALAAKKIVKTGEKRATTYFAAK
jgi:Fic family protein